jgi:putative phosphoribosyl transferase
MIFVDRSEAGRMLAERLATEPVVRDASRLLTLAVPRGGLPVGIQVARRLGGDFDVAVATRLRAPHDPDVAFGSVAADGNVDVDEATVAQLGLRREEVEAEVERRRASVERRLALYRQVIGPASVEGAVVVVVDDGIASGGTARQACRLARRLGAEQVVLAVPVAPVTAEAHLAAEADRIVVLTVPAEFLAVGQAYQQFPRLDDEDLVRLFEDAPASRSS